LREQGRLSEDEFVAAKALVLLSTRRLVRVSYTREAFRYKK